MLDDLAPASQDLNELKIRPVKPGDCFGLIALLNTRDGRRTAPSPTQRDSIPATIRRQLETDDPESLRLVAVCGGEIVGEARLRLIAKIGWLTIAVRDDHRGRGIGTALLGDLIQAAEDRLFTYRMALKVFADNGPALRLYRKFGFDVGASHFDASGREILSMARNVKM